MNSFSDFEGFSPHSSVVSVSTGAKQAAQQLQVRATETRVFAVGWSVGGGFACLGLALMFHYEPSAYRVI